MRELLPNPKPVQQAFEVYAWLLGLVVVGALVTGADVLGVVAGAAMLGGPAVLAIVGVYFLPASPSTQRGEAFARVLLANVCGAALLVSAGLINGSGVPLRLDSAVIAGILAAAVTWVVISITAMIADALLNSVRAFVSYPACETCGYNLTGNLSGRCPECGTSIGAKSS